MGFRSWFKAFSDRRRTWRIQASGVTACYWNGGIPKPRPVRDIGPGGAYILAPDSFYPDTIVQIAFEHSNSGTGHICVSSQVKRSTADGFCVNFLLNSSRERYMVYDFMAGVKSAAAVATNQPDLRPAAELPAAESASSISGGNERDFPGGYGATNHSSTRRVRRGKSGQSLVEFALLLPLLMLLIVNVVNFGGMMYAWIAVSNAARTGAQYLITGPAAIGGPTAPTPSTIQTLVLADIHALPNSATTQVCVSSSSSSTVSCNSGATPSSAPPAADTAEGSPPITYVVGAVDVTYTYTPLIPLWDFTALHIHATLPPTTIHRQAVMRLLQ